MEQKIHELEVLIKGVDGQNGLRSKTRELELEIQEIKKMIAERDLQHTKERAADTALMREMFTNASMEMLRSQNKFNRYIYIAIGALAVIQILLPFVLPHIMKTP